MRAALRGMKKNWRIVIIQSCVYDFTLGWGTGDSIADFHHVVSRRKNTHILMAKKAFGKVEDTIISEAYSNL